jgi:hypothetical protein
MDRKMPTRVRPGNDRFQYFPDLQVKFLNVRVGFDTGHPSESLRYFSGRTGIPQKLTVPMINLEGDFAAELTVPIIPAYFAYCPSTVSRMLVNRMH